MGRREGAGLAKNAVDIWRLWTGISAEKKEEPGQRPQPRRRWQRRLPLESPFRGRI